MRIILCVKPSACRKPIIFWQVDDPAITKINIHSIENDDGSRKRTEKKRLPNSQEAKTIIIFVNNQNYEKLQPGQRKHNKTCQIMRTQPVHRESMWQADESSAHWDVVIVHLPLLEFALYEHHPQITARKTGDVSTRRTSRYFARTANPNPNPNPKNSADHDFDN